MAMPIFYATGSKWKVGTGWRHTRAAARPWHQQQQQQRAMPQARGHAVLSCCCTCCCTIWPAPIHCRCTSRLLQGFLWGSLAGLAEPVGGLVGYLAVHDRVGGWVGGCVRGQDWAAEADAKQQDWGGRGRLVRMVPLEAVCSAAASPCQPRQHCFAVRLKACALLPRPRPAFTPCPSQSRPQDPLAFGITFGVVGGMMVFVSIQELLPAAFQFDPDNTMVSKSEWVGPMLWATACEETAWNLHQVGTIAIPTAVSSSTKPTPTHPPTHPCCRHHRWDGRDGGIAAPVHTLTQGACTLRCDGGLRRHGLSARLLRFPDSTDLTAETCMT